MISLKAPAKINLFLKIVRKRPDGFHDLASLFQTVSIYDELSLELSDQDSFSCSETNLENNDNLVMKALNMFRAKLAKPFFVSVTLKKSIPSQAGLGGGSSDAASMLNGLNQLLDHPLNYQDLHEIASTLGSDIPFFLTGGAAFCEGRGEIITQVKLPEEKSLWVVKPPINLATPRVFKNLDLASLPDENVDNALKSHLEGDGVFFNDLEPTALKLEPDLQSLKSSLVMQGFKDILMSGSGSAFFCFGPMKPVLPPEYEVYPCHYVS